MAPSRGTQSAVRIPVSFGPCHLLPVAFLLKENLARVCSDVNECCAYPSAIGHVGSPWSVQSWREHHFDSECLRWQQDVADRRNRSEVSKIFLRLRGYWAAAMPLKRRTICESSGNSFFDPPQGVAASVDFRHRRTLSRHHRSPASWSAAITSALRPGGHLVVICHDRVHHDRPVAVLTESRRCGLVYVNHVLVLSRLLSGGGIFLAAKTRLARTMHHVLADLYVFTKPGRSSGSTLRSVQAERSREPLSSRLRQPMSGDAVDRGQSSASGRPITHGDCESGLRLPAFTAWSTCVRSLTVDIQRLRRAV